MEEFIENFQAFQEMMVTLKEDPNYYSMDDVIESFYTLELDKAF